MKFKLAPIMVLALIAATSLSARADCKQVVVSGGAPTNLSTTNIRLGPGEYGSARDWNVAGNKHTGVDIVMNQSSNDPVAYQVSAVADGKVAYVRDNGAFGNIVVLDHGDGCYSLYAHLANKPFTPMENGGNAFVKLTDDVRAGQKIGFMRNLAGDTDASGNAQNVSDATARTQVHFVLIVAPSGRTSATTLKPGIFNNDTAYVDPTPLLTRLGYRKH